MTVDARNRSLLAPKVLVYDAAGTLVGSAAADYGQAATVTVGGLTPGQAYYLAADGATADAFGMGAYALTAQFSSPTLPPAPAAPTGLAAAAASGTQVNLAWRDNASNEDGYRVERSADGGATFAFVANAPAGATAYAVTGLAPGTAYAFRVRAFNAGGDSAWSNTAQATTQGLPPTANPDAYSTAHDQTLSVAGAAGVLANDASNPAGRPLTTALVAGPAHGTLTLNANGSFTYKPAAHFAGSDSFTYMANDGTVASSAATVTLSVTDQAPSGAGDTYTAARDATLTVAAPGVLANDTDPDGDTVTAVLATGPAHGTLTLNPNGSITYTPAAGFAGTDGFTYSASDGLLSSPPQTVTITVRDASPVPQADAYTLRHDRTFTVGGAAGVLANDTSPGGLAMAAVLPVKPAHGAVTLYRNGAFVYTPARGFVGADSFTYRARSAGGTSAPMTVSLAVIDRAPAAAADLFKVPEGRRLVRYSPGVLANDTDADGDARTAALVTGPAHGTLALYPNGAFVYTPEPGFVGTDSFQYRAVTRLQASDPATVTISVLAPPQVTSVVINDGSAQRSLVRSITITFDMPVTFDPGAFGLRGRGRAPHPDPDGHSGQWADHGRADVRRVGNPIRIAGRRGLGAPRVRVPGGTGPTCGRRSWVRARRTGSTGCSGTRTATGTWTTTTGRLSTPPSGRRMPPPWPRSTSTATGRWTPRTVPGSTGGSAGKSDTCAAGKPNANGHRVQGLGVRSVGIRRARPRRTTSGRPTATSCRARL